MKYKTINNITLPVLGIGTWGGPWGKDNIPNPLDKQICVDAIKQAITLGMTHIDTSELYGLGSAETIIGEAIQEFDRKDIFITTKVIGNHLSYESVIKAFNSSLARLKTDYVDLYLVHWPNSENPIAETMKAMNELVDKKLVRFIGVSNFSLSELKEAQKHSQHKLVANQVEYNLIRRNNGRHSKNVESEIIPYCQENDIFIISYKPLALGEFTKAGYLLLDNLAKKYNKTQSQIALNWLLSKKNVITIPGTTNEEHMKENLGAIGWKLEKEDIKLLNHFC